MRRKLPRRAAAPRLCSAILLLGARALAQAEEPPSAGAGREAEASPLQLSWSSSEPDCSGNLVAARALQMVGRDVTPPAVDARAEVSRVGPTWTVKLETRSDNQTGTRVLNGETCKEIQDAVALLLTMILESEVAAVPSPAPDRPDVPPGPVPPPAPTSQPSPSVSPITEARPEADVIDQRGADTAPEPGGGESELGGLARLHGGATLGLEPDVWLGFGAAVGLYWRSLDVAVVGNYWPSTRVGIEGSTGHVEISRLAVGLRGCFTAWSPGHLDVAGCLLPELTLFRYSSHGIEDESRGAADHLLVSGTSAVELRYRPVGRHFSIVLSPGVTWEKAQPFHVRVLCQEAPCDPIQSREVHRTSGLGVRLEMGLEARF